MIYWATISFSKKNVLHEVSYSSLSCIIINLWAPKASREVFKSKTGTVKFSQNLFNWDSPTVKVFRRFAWKHTLSRKCTERCSCAESVRMVLWTLCLGIRFCEYKTSHCLIWRCARHRMPSGGNFNFLFIRPFYSHMRSVYWEMPHMPLEEQLVYSAKLIR